MAEFSLIKSFPSFVLDVNFKTDGGSVTGLFGRSGSGKTTVINIAAGLTKPDSGYFSIGGRVLFDSKNKIDIPAQKRNAGYIFQDGRLFPHMTVEANLRYGMKKIIGETKADFKDVTELLGISDLLKRRPHKLSGGEKQRVAIGRALLSSPDFLLMDEPLSALDTHRKEELIPFISKMVQTFKLPVLYVTHSLEELLSLCDNVVLLNNGKCTDYGSVEDVVSRPTNRDVLSLSGRVSVLRAVAVDEHTHCEQPIKNGLFHMPTSKYAAGVELRVAVSSEDITIALQKPENISARNIIKTVITNIENAENGMVYVTLDVGTPVYAAITKGALEDLNLRTGLEVYAIMKTIALSRLSVPVLA